MGQWMSNAFKESDDLVTASKADDSTSSTSDLFTKYRDPASKPFDPRSISDDVVRTPIVTADTPPDTPNEDQNAHVKDDTPNQQSLQKKFKSLSLDPRSPSGIPRTPILVESEADKNNAKKISATPNNTPKAELKPVKRGQMAKKNLPVSKLTFTPDDKVVEESPEVVMLTTENDENVPSNEDEREALVKSTIKPVESPEVVILNDEEERKPFAPVNNTLVI